MAAAPHPWLAATQHVEEACDLLVDPSSENLDFCSRALAAAVNRLAHTERPAAPEIRHLRTSIHRARSLLELAAAYHRHWREILQAKTAGYTSAGETVPLSPPGTVWMQG